MFWNDLTKIKGKAVRLSTRTEVVVLSTAPVILRLWKDNYVQ